MNDFESHDLQQKEKSRYWLSVFLYIVLICAILCGGKFLFPKVKSRFVIWNEERKLSQYHEEIADIEETAYTELKEENDKEEEEDTRSEAENFLQKIYDLDVSEIPEEKILAVPYYCQNPFRDAAGWDTHDASCEEAALFQAYLYLSGEEPTIQEAHETFLDMIEWEKKPEHFGGHIDLYGEDMERFIIEYYELDKNSVVHLFDLDEMTIKKVITLGYPIIAPIQGELLQNPFYPYPGYHMLTIIGFSGDQVITNDVGTKRGEKYPYSFDRLLTATKPVGNDGFVLLSIEKKDNVEEEEVVNDGDSTDYR